MDAKIFDLQAVLARVDDDKELLFDIIDTFFSSYQEQLGTIESAVVASNADTLNHAAHSIKGALGNLGATLSYELAQKLELAGKTNNLGDAQSLFDQLKIAITAFKGEVENYRSQVT